LRSGCPKTADPATRIRAPAATTSGAVALVAVPSTTDQKANIWAFVPAGCVQPDRKHGYSTVYFPRVVQVDHLPDNPITSSELHKHSDKYGCHGPVRSSAAPRLGWVWDPKNKPACPV